MSNIIKATFITATLLFSFNSFALKWDTQRKNMKKLVLEGHKALTSYTNARKHIMQKLHLGNDTWGYYVKDVYCNERVRQKVGPKKMPSHTVINVEHTWPQSRFNKSKSKSVQKADLHHLFPTDSVANSTRGNHKFGDVRYGSSVGNCNDSKFGQITSGDELVFQPPREHRGNVARALFYFSIRYDIDIPDYEEEMLMKWHRQDPVDAFERSRNEAISKIQGNRNPFIDRPYNAQLISDF